MSKYKLFLIILSSCIIPLLLGQMSCVTNKHESHENLLAYKKTESGTLYLEMIKPVVSPKETPNTSIIFFFGGGWRNGDRTHFTHHADYFSKKGYTCFLADYRTESNSGTTPFDAVEDAKSAMRYLKENSKKLQINPDRIIASGGSAGGHLAAACAFIEDYNDPSDNLDISPIPYALLLYNPVIDNGPTGYGFERVGEEYKSFSPLHNIKSSAPPTIFFLGDSDNLIPIETAYKYQEAYEAIGARCDVKIYPNAGHGFFNFRNREFFDQTIAESESFLASLGN